MTGPVIVDRRYASRVMPARLAICALAPFALLTPTAADAREENRWFASQHSRSSEVAAASSQPVSAPAGDASTSAGGTFGSFFDGFSSGPARPTGRPTLSRANIAPTKTAIARYRKIAKAGGWKPIPKAAVKLKLQRGMKHPAVSLLRARLIATGDMQPSTALSSSFDYYVEQGLMRFQRRHGLKPTGNLVNKSRRRRLGTRTLTALNVSAKARMRQLQANLTRLRSHVSRASKKRYVVVNIPSQKVEAVENGKVALRHTAVVGKKGRATPLLTSRVHRVKFNPTWTLPPTVIRDDLIPHGRRLQARKGDVLAKFGIDAYRTHGGKKLNSSKINWRGGAVHSYVYKQPPGKTNPLGFVKIDFHNAHSVYMHDTPSQRIFGREDRAASSGCIRIQGIGKLVAWLLRENKEPWSHGRVMGMKKTGKTKNVSLRRPVPLHFIYVTAWADPSGRVSFRPDIYDRDRRYGVRTVSSAY
ncbi:MAG: L,D-transpeptidase family protein [Pseudomonadota bacterium]